MNIAIIKSREIRLVNFFSNIANRWLFSKKLNHFLQKILYCTFDIFAPQRAFWPEYTRPGTKGMASKSNSTKIRLRCHYKRTKTHKKTIKNDLTTQTYYPPFKLDIIWIHKVITFSFHPYKSHWPYLPWWPYWPRWACSPS